MTTLQADIPVRTADMVDSQRGDIVLFRGSRVLAQTCYDYWAAHVRTAMNRIADDEFSVTVPRMQRGFVAFDLDGTLAHASDHHDWPAIGKPVLNMIRRAQYMLITGQELCVFTARGGEPHQVQLVQNWCWEHLRLWCLITNVKRYDIRVFYDDRAVTIVPNTGMTHSEMNADDK